MMLDGSNRSKWCMSIDLLAHAICTCYFKGDSVIVYKIVISCAHAVVVVFEAAIVLQNKSIKLFRDATTGPNLNLTIDHMCLLHSLDFGCIQRSRCRNCFWLCLKLLLTLHWYRFSFHMHDMILARSYYRLFSHAVASVDGWCLYIIINHSISCRTSL